jgi:uncharacterized protein (TIGR02145 family)
MKKLFISLLLINTIISCKKSNTIPTPVPTPKTDDTTNVVLNDSVSCVENSAINFTCKGTPIGSFGPCIKDIDGNIYKTVMIGDQYWMSENLRVNKYNDGSLIDNVTDSVKWCSDKNGAWSYYNNDVKYNEKYGKIYNWNVLDTILHKDKNVCPIGWHIPSQKEWRELITFLGGDKVAGAKMKELTTTSWLSTSTNTNNSSLFTGIPGAYRDPNNKFAMLGFTGNWWSYDVFSESYVNTYMLHVYKDNIIEDLSDKKSGLSIRCIKD